MNKEELVNLNMKDVILDKWKSKKGYILNNKDLEELKNIIDYYEQKNKELHNKIDKAITLIEKNISELRQLGEKEEEKDRWTALTIYAVKNSFFEVEEILKDSDVDE